MEPFETERLFVRQFTADDAVNLFLFNSSKQVMQFIRPVKNREESDAFLEENLNLYLEGFPYGRMMVEDKHTKVFIGTYSILYLDGEADYHIGYALMPEHWGKGYASELVNFGSALFFESTKHTTLFAITQPENKASETVLLKNKFKLTGKFLLDDKILNRFSLTRADFYEKGS